MAKTKIELLDLLAANRVQELCDELQIQLLRMQPLNEVALLEGQWNALADFARTGAMSFEQVALEQAKIRARLADFIEKLGREGDLKSTAFGTQKGFLKKWWAVGLAFFGLFIGAFWFFKSRANEAEKAFSTEKSPKSEQKAADLPAEQPAAELDGQRILKVKSRSFTLKSPLVGEVGFRFAQVVLRPYNSSQNELTIGLFVQPEADRSLAFQPGGFSLKNGSESLAMESVQPNFLEAGASKSVRVRFLIPAAWQNATFVVRHGVVPPMAEERIEIDLKN